MGILELQETRRYFARARPECGRSLSFNRSVGAYRRGRKGSPRFSHSGGTNPNRCHCATCATRTPGDEIYRNKRGRPYSFDSTDGTTSYSFSIVVAGFDPFRVTEILFTFTARNLRVQAFFPKPSPTICFYLKTIRGKLDKLLWKVTCSQDSARFKLSLREPRFKPTELGGPRRFTPTHA